MYFFELSNSDLAKISLFLFAPSRPRVYREDFFRDQAAIVVVGDQHFVLGRSWNAGKTVKSWRQVTANVLSNNGLRVGGNVPQIE
ncbi:hypothetical protein pipiens_013776 [Culex pipiens pipiens]|uniref:Uncharacterized protein n=1 Tax=Culex pipiens pipiens TaxID=38569 RepID=A0ABD1CZK8_CULPP